MRLLVAMLALLSVAALTLADSAPQNTLPPLLRLWPDAVPVPRGLRPYERTQFSQRLVILNDADHLSLVPLNQDDDLFNKPNPNRKDEWRVNGGLHAAVGWQSYTGLALPDGASIRTWTDRVEAGARRPLPRWFWQFPEGTRVVDLLTEGDRPFELRMLKRENGGWKGHVVWEAEHKPRGYESLTTTCASCHAFTGASYGYGTILRGSGGIFSWSPFVNDGTFTFRKDVPIKPWGN